MDLAPGTELGRYAIQSLLGEGAMGKVYRAFDSRLRRAVAIKILAPPGEGEEEAIAAALREARAAAAILHPNATAVFDADRAGDTSFIVMELVPGASLRQYVGDASVPVGVRLRWLVEVGGALAAAHEAGVVHGDVKPENVMVREDGLVKVLDFGIARVPRASIRTPTSPQGLLGTPAYMAPEHVRGQAVDGRADQFGWGVLAYELLAGRLPWANAAEPITALAAVLAEEPVPLPTGPDLPPEVVAAVLRALSKAAADRFPTMADAVAAIMPFALRRPIPDAPAPDSLRVPGLADRPSISISPTHTQPSPGPVPAERAPVSSRFHEQVAPSAGSIPPPSPPALSSPTGPSHAGAAIHEPDFSAPVDLDAHLALLPIRATCKGLFFLDLLRRGAAALPPGELCRIAGIPERRYVAFRDYPMADNMHLTVAVALALHPSVPLGEGLRRLGQTAFETVSASLVGKTLFGAFGRDVATILLNGPRAFRLFLNFGDVTAEQTAPGRFLFHAFYLPLFLDTYQVGVLEGVLRHAGVEGRVRVAIETLDHATAEIVLL